MAGGSAGGRDDARRGTQSGSGRRSGTGRQPGSVGRAGAGGAGATDTNTGGRGGLSEARRYTPRGRTVRESDPRRGDPFRPALEVIEGGRRAGGRAKAPAEPTAPTPARKPVKPVKKAAPKTAAPKTAAPSRAKKAAPKTAAPKTAAPKTAAPKTASNGRRQGASGPRSSPGWFTAARTGSAPRGAPPSAIRARRDRPGCPDRRAAPPACAWPPSSRSRCSWSSPVDSSCSSWSTPARTRPRASRPGCTRLSCRRRAARSSTAAATSSCTASRPATSPPTRPRSTTRRPPPTQLFSILGNYGVLRSDLVRKLSPHKTSNGRTDRPVRVPGARHRHRRRRPGQRAAAARRRRRPRRAPRGARPRPGGQRDRLHRPRHHTGLAGIEAAYDDLLRGVDGKRTYEIGRRQPGQGDPRRVPRSRHRRGRAARWS